MRKNGYKLKPEALQRLEKHLSEKYQNMPSYLVAKEISFSKDTFRRVLQQDIYSPTVSLTTLQTVADRVGFDLKESDYEYTHTKVEQGISLGIDTFKVRGRIEDPNAFWGREAVLQRLQSFLRRGANCHIIGESCVGKSSLLNHLCYIIEKEEAHQNTEIAFLDMNNFRTHTPLGMLQVIAEKFGWTPSPTSEYEFARLLAESLSRDTRYIIIFDTFDNYSSRPDDESERAFWQYMRSVSETDGVRMFTTSDKHLSQIVSASGQTSPFTNLFAEIPLPRFELEEATGFVELRRDGIPPFTPAEVKIIVETSGCHPFALQLLCDYLLQSKIGSGVISMEDALNAAAMEISRLIKGWK